MNAPVIWIVVPLVTAFGLWFIQEKRRLVVLISSILCGLLGLTAVFQNFDGVLRVGPLAIKINTTLGIFGRNFVLDNSDRSFLAFIFLGLVFWIVGSYVANVATKFVPLSMAVAALFTAGMAVEPFLYSAILIELAVIISLPLLINSGTGVGKGVLRLLIFQSLAMPMILLAGWILSGVRTNFSDISQLYSAGIFLGLGFAFLLGIFPFHFWIPEFCSENDIYINAFLLCVQPIAYVLILIDFINGLPWLNEASFLIPTLRICGMIMIVTGGILAAMQTDLRRIFGFFVILETGYMLACVSLRNELGVQLSNFMIISRELEIAMMALALKTFQSRQVGLDFTHMSGKMRELPVASTALIVAMFSGAGLPLLASFPSRVALLNQLSVRPVVLIWILIGMGASLFISCRLLRVIIPATHGRWELGESRQEIVLFVMGVFFILLIGIFPSIFLGDLVNGLLSFITG
jgi:formate hydrogenlyase subunit 3/multisubunit Na+/H+ antiporter MnhD subunit